jgi:hypothetical protein
MIGGREDLVELIRFINGRCQSMIVGTENVSGIEMLHFNQSVASQEKVASEYRRSFST